jgi:hypothetical protein
MGLGVSIKPLKSADAAALLMHDDDIFREPPWCCPAFFLCSTFKSCLFGSAGSQALVFSFCLCPVLSFVLVDSGVQSLRPCLLFAAVLL